MSVPASSPQPLIIGSGQTNTTANFILRNKRGIFIAILRCTPALLIKCHVALF